MSHGFLFNASFHSLLNTIDQELAEEVQKKGCTFCGGKLHQSDYPRSPMGISAQLRHHYESRLSFCCDACRKRITPSSVRFFGRRWFPAPFLVLVSVLTLGINERRLAQIQKYFGLVVSESTWKRWRKWWQELFVTTLFWLQAKGLVQTALDVNLPFPRALLTLFQGGLDEKLRLLLRFLAPLTGGILCAV